MARDTEGLSRVISDELQAAYQSALDFVTELRDQQPQEVYQDTELRHAVMTEALATMAHRPNLARALANAWAPVPCSREGCKNDANEGNWDSRHGLPFCSAGCLQWYRRDEKRKRDRLKHNPRCMGCAARAERGRVFCSRECRVNFPANNRPYAVSA